MSPALFLLPVLAAAVAVPANEPIVVKAHAWAPFISPMGEPFRARTADDDTLANWFRQADRDQNGALTAVELVTDADRFFATLDANHDGEIDPDELVKYEWEIAPDVQLMSRTRPAPGHSMLGASDRTRERGRHSDKIGDEDEVVHAPGGLQGAARYGLLNLPEPVAAADANFDRSISLAEFRAAAVERFQLLDATHVGRLSLAQLQAMRPVLPTDRNFKPTKGALDARIGNPLPPGN